MNRQRAAKMTELGLMTEHGHALIELTRADGTWQVLPDAENLAIPDDLQELLDRNEAAGKNFQNFPPSSKRLILEWERPRKGRTPGGARSIKRSISRR